MKTLIVYVSTHHGNTEKIAEAIGKILEAKLLKPNEADAETVSKCDLVGFGSGIYFFKHHRHLLRFVDELPEMRNKKAFVFSTSGGGSSRYHQPLKKKLLEKGFEIIGEFSCKGFDTYCLFKLVGGLNKGRPNEEDLQRARSFAQKLIAKTKHI